MNDKLTQTYKLLIGELQEWFELAVKMIPNLIVASILMLVFILIAKGSRSLSEKLLGRISDNKAVTKLLSALIYLAITSFGLFIALGIMDLDKTVTSLLAGAGVIGLVLGFAFQELSSNFISGIFIAFHKPFRVDDVIQTGEHLGQVERINLRATVIRTFEGQDVFIPNVQLLTAPVINFTNDPRRMLKLEVGVSYSEDLQLVEDTILDALKEFDGCHYPKETLVHFREFGESSINLVVRFWINYPGEDNYYRSTHAAIKKIKNAFDAKGITIPFPIRTVEIR